jgi:hypothetical protein
MDRSDAQLAAVELATRLAVRSQMLLGTCIMARKEAGSLGAHSPPCG